MSKHVRCRSLATLQAGRILSLLILACVDAAGQQPSCAGRALPQVSAVAIPLDQTDLARRDVGRLRYRGGILLQHHDPRFGAFSGMVVSNQGKRLLAVNDGYWLDAALAYDASGNLSGFQMSCFGELLDENGKPLEWWEDKDAEALTFDGEKFLVGFEENLRVWSYSNFSAPAKNVPLPPDFTNGVPPGGGYSSIASDGPGRFYLITEFGRNTAKDTKGYMHTDSASGEVWIVARDGERIYLPVDLAALPNGDFVLAEISLVQVSDVSFQYLKLRLSIIPKATLVPGGRITPTTIADMEPPMIAEKYEGVAARSGPNGETLIYIMSDDGRMRGGRTVIRMFELLKP
jgi:hypothetical protein